MRLPLACKAKGKALRRLSQRERGFLTLRGVNRFVATQGFPTIVVGLTALGGLLGCGLSAAWRLRHAVTRERRLFGAGALAALVGLCLAGVVELSLLRLWVVITLFTLLGVIAHLSSSSDTAKGDRV